MVICLLILTSISNSHAGGIYLFFFFFFSHSCAPSDRLFHCWSFSFWPHGAQEKKTFFFLFPPPPDQIAPSSSIYIYAQAWHYMTSSSILLFPYILFSLPSTENLRPLSDDRPRQKRFVTFLTGLDHHPHI